ncbi:type II toxin-antitoxin system death-on-curing family toxin [Magnetospirillum sp. UT-4]|uniref:type II toxin-antitoxin system death-on-curing family toxin n=1 Tax=Magnetospirillum sp. UT-4 TaxID=2681467 RepID=UPI00137EEEFD|nr:type II toxin-antitoxin system death-on-curing family toxin [Magnetospirillum sp. UT-4]CAA7626964.1 Death-on-curing family protein [Magnetospirillum sp. UT-4]
MTWRWVSPHLAVSWHARLIGLYGGAPGIRDLGLVEGALARPRNLVAYEGPDVTTERLAVLYGIGLAKAHGFVDGNKRIGFAAMVAFLKAHGRILDVTEAEATRVMQEVAAGTMGEAELERWLLAHCR